MIKLFTGPFLFRGIYLFTNLVALTFPVIQLIHTFRIQYKQVPDSVMKISYVSLWNMDVRVLNGNVKAPAMNSQGYLDVREQNGDIRQINPRTIRNLQIGKSCYAVKP